MKFPKLIILLNIAAIIVVIAFWQIVKRTKNTNSVIIHPPVSVSPEPAAAFGHVPEFTLINQNGEPFGSNELHGKIWITNFIFTRCRQTCPVQTKKMAEILDRFKTLPSYKDIYLLSITVDPGHDTPEELQKYANDYEIGDRWFFLTGDRADIWNLSKKGFKLAVGEATEDPEIPLFHSPKIILVDSRRSIRGYFDSSSEEELNMMIDKVANLIKEQ